MRIDKEELDLTNSEDAWLFLTWLKNKYSWRTENKQDTEDLASVAFLKSLKCQKRNGIIMGHLFKIAKDTLTDYHKGGIKRHRLLSTDPIIIEQTVSNLQKESWREIPESDLEKTLIKIDKNGLEIEDSPLVFELVRTGKLKHFPYEYFEEDRQEKVRRILAHLREMVWKCPTKEMWQKKSIEYSEVHLRWVATKYYGTIDNFLIEGFGNTERPKVIPQTKWSEETTDIMAMRAVRDMFEDLKQKNEVNKPGDLKKAHFKRYGLYGAYQKKFKNRKDIAIIASFPNLEYVDIFKSRYRWTIEPEKTRARLKIFLNTKGIDSENLPSKINKRIFLKTPYWAIFHKYNTLYKFADFVFPGKWTVKEFNDGRREYVDLLGRKPFQRYVKQTKNNK